MTTIPSKRYKRQSLPDPMVVLTYTLVLGALLFWGARASSFYTATGRNFRSESILSNISAESEVSFAADVQYWDANCAHGWESDSACNMIFTRAQSCEISTASTYCSDYKTYMRQFLDQ